MTVIYRIFLVLYLAGINLASFFGNSKARKWLQGRRGINALLAALPRDEKRAWFHCASLGEFEQGRPVIENFKRKNPGIKIVLTFFSPSGFEVRKNYAGADFIYYLPSDSPSNAKFFIDAVRPVAVFFIKYDYWYFYLRTLSEKNIPVYVVSSIFRKEQVFFSWYGIFFRTMLKYITHFFVQDAVSGNLLESIGISNYTISGDTRFDRVLEVAADPKDLGMASQFAPRDSLLVAGSTWTEDEKMLSEIMPAFPNLKIIIAPHEVNDSRLRELRERFPASTLLSEATPETLSGASVLIVDSIGLLSSLYRLGKTAYIGGGFGRGIHNVLEAAVYCIPVCFGPNYHKFNEAIALVQCGGAKSISSSAELEDTLKIYLNDSTAYTAAANAAGDYVKKNAGATHIILSSPAMIWNEIQS